MNILLCPDKFKGSLSSENVCLALEKGLLESNTNLTVEIHPMADGGDGSVEILLPLLKLDPITHSCVDPLNRKISAKYYHSEGTAFIELASASGLILLKDNERNPLITTTYGTGLMIKDAIERGFKNILLFIGGSATNDGGIGIASALGFKFLDKQGIPLAPIGESLRKIHTIVKCADYSSVNITVLCDVTNPMYGSNGAAYIYAGQKGASINDIEILDLGLRNFADVLHSQYDIDLSNEAGIGAAGGVSASLIGLLDAKLENGFDMLADITRLEDAIKRADLIITGEGKIDRTSFDGKVVGNVLNLCNKNNKPCGLVGGIIENKEIYNLEFVFQKSIFTLAKDLNQAISSAEEFLYRIGLDIGTNHINLLSKLNIEMKVFHEIENKLQADGYTLERKDVNRPWGGFFVINESHKQQFINQFFEGKLTSNVNSEMKLSPKILIVAPNKRLSWQYHHRRSELWQVVDGSVGVVRSETDLEADMKIYHTGARIEIANGERHRLIGLESYGVVAEIWVHENANNPSDEDDIVRIQDDYGRK